MLRFGTLHARISRVSSPDLWPEQVKFAGSADSRELARVDGHVPAGNIGVAARGTPP